MKTLPRKPTGHLKTIVEGEVIPPGDAGYDDVRRISNARSTSALKFCGSLSLGHSR